MKKILCIDIGNTNIVFGISSDCREDLTFTHFRVTSNHNTTVDEVSLLVFNVLNYFKVSYEIVSNVIISSVVPEVNIQFRNGIYNLLGIEPIFIEANDIPLEIDYQNKYEIGSDRVVDAYAAKELYSPNSIVVDTGTATTVDLVLNGVYHGGAIMPGVYTSLHAIYQKASKIPKISIDVPKRVIGKTTEECLRSGIIMGLSKGIEGVISEMKKEIGFEDFKIIFTGGISDKIFPLVNEKNKVIDKDLTLKGLKLLAFDISIKR